MITKTKIEILSICHPHSRLSIVLDILSIFLNYFVVKKRFIAFAIFASFFVTADCKFMECRSLKNIVWLENEINILKGKFQRIMCWNFFLLNVQTNFLNLLRWTLSGKNTLFCWIIKHTSWHYASGSNWLPLSKPQMFASVSSSNFNNLHQS